MTDGKLDWLDFNDVKRPFLPFSLEEWGRLDDAQTAIDASPEEPSTEALALRSAQAALMRLASLTETGGAAKDCLAAIATELARQAATKEAILPKREVGRPAHYDMWLGRARAIVAVKWLSALHVDALSETKANEWVANHLGVSSKTLRSWKSELARTKGGPDVIRIQRAKAQAMGEARAAIEGGMLGVSRERVFTWMKSNPRLIVAKRSRR